MVCIFPTPVGPLGQLHLPPLSQKTALLPLHLPPYVHDQVSFSDPKEAPPQAIPLQTNFSFKMALKFFYRVSLLSVAGGYAAVFIKFSPTALHPQSCLCPAVKTAFFTSCPSVPTLCETRAATPERDIQCVSTETQPQGVWASRQTPQCSGDPAGAVRVGGGEGVEGGRGGRVGRPIGGQEGAARA